MQNIPVELRCRIISMGWQPVFVVAFYQVSYIYRQNYSIFRLIVILADAVKTQRNLHGLRTDVYLQDKIINFYAGDYVKLLFVCQVLYHAITLIAPCAISFLKKVYMPSVYCLSFANHFDDYRQRSINKFIRV